MSHLWNILNEDWSLEMDCKMHNVQLIPQPVQVKMSASGFQSLLAFELSGSVSLETLAVANTLYRFIVTNS